MASVHSYIDTVPSDINSDFNVAAAMACYNDYGDSGPVQLSQRLSAIARRPILAVNLDLLPHRPLSLDVRLSSEEVDDHAAILKRYATLAAPREKAWRKWKWKESGSICSVDSRSWSVDDPHDESLPSRLIGAYWIKAAIMTTVSRKTNNHELWSDMSSLPLNAIEKFPSGDAVRLYNFGHEWGHILQRFPTRFLRDPAIWWQTEKDADEAAFSGLSLLANQPAHMHRAAEFRETIEAVIHGRILAGFRAAPPHYWSGLFFDGKDVGYEKSLLCGYELRFRVLGEMKGMVFPDSSEDIQTLIKNWQTRTNITKECADHLDQTFGPFAKPWSHCMDVHECIPVLQKVLDKITDPLTRHNAKLVIEAATYFCPSLEKSLTTEPGRIVPFEAPVRAARDYALN